MFCLDDVLIALPSNSSHKSSRLFIRNRQFIYNYGAIFLHVITREKLTARYKGNSKCSSHSVYWTLIFIRTFTRWLCFSDIFRKNRIKNDHHSIKVKKMLALFIYKKLSMRTAKRNSSKPWSSKWNWQEKGNHFPNKASKGNLQPREVKPRETF